MKLLLILSFSVVSMMSPPATSAVNDPEAGSQAAAALGKGRAFSFPTTGGIALRYELEEPFMGMTTGNYELTNGNGYPVEISFTAVYTLETGKVQRSSKGPIRMAALTSGRTGWAGGGDAWEKGATPKQVSIENFKVTRR